MIEKKSAVVYKIIMHLILMIVSISCVVPFLIIISTSLSSRYGFALNGYTILPKEIDLSTYKYITNGKEILRAYGVTIFITVAGTLLGMFLMTTLAYVISRRDYRFRNAISFFIYFTMLFSGGVVANYIWLARDLHLTNNILVLILPSCMSAWSVFILRVSCQNIPLSLIENAKIEGAGELRIFFSIVVPLSKIGIATIALLTAFRYWNEWFASMMYMDGGKYVTLQYYLVRVLEKVNFAKTHAADSGGLISAKDVPDAGLTMAICVLASGPAMCIFPFFQKYFVKGITVGAVKG